jgi:uncharacterized membrane-anchored protein
MSHTTTIMGTLGKLLSDLDELYRDKEAQREQEHEERVEVYKKKVKKLKKRKTEKLHLPTGTSIYREWNGTEYEARWDNEHQRIIDEYGEAYNFPSGWAKSISGLSSSGWDVCYIWDEDEKIPLSRLRLTKRIPRRRGGQSPPLKPQFNV